MDSEFYLNKFENTAKSLDQEGLKKSGLEIQTGIWLNSVVLRIQKNHWANNPNDKPHSGSAIFMGIWINDEAVYNQKIMYNIHALRLRQLKGYALQSRAFAASFREKFKKHKHAWKNVSSQFGPQTLIEGWLPLNKKQVQRDISNLANNFIEIEQLIEETLSEFKK